MSSRTSPRIRTVSSMGNERLRTRLAAQRMTASELAAAIEVDPKTVERWISVGRVPHQRHRAQTARLLDAEESYLWPQALTDERRRAASQAEILAVYPQRAAVPAELWWQLADSARTHVEVLVYSGLFLLDSRPDLLRSLADRAAAGLETRLLFGDPDSDMVRLRGADEGIHEEMPARIRLSLAVVKPHVGPGIEVRLHETVLYNSIYRFDDQMLVNTHIVGSPAPKNPVLHLQRVEGGHLFEHYLQSFDHVWETASPLLP